MQVEPYEPNIMHVLTTQDMIGSALWSLCYQVLPGSPSNNMSTVWGCIVDYYSEHKVVTQYSNLTLASFCDPATPHRDFPKLKGRGAESKDLVAPLLHTWSIFMRHGQHHDVLVHTLLTKQLQIQDILHENKRYAFLPNDLAEKVLETIEQLLETYTLLCNEADRNHVLLWNMAPKFHWLWHLGHKARYLNPRRGNCMIDEDFVGVAKTIVQSCASGTAAHNVPSSFIDKYRWGLHMLNRYGDEFLRM